MKILYAKFASYRMKKYKISTKIIMNASGKKEVVKESLNPLNDFFIVSIFNNYEKLKRSFHNVSICPCRIEDHKVFFEFIEGKSLKTLFVEKLLSKDIDQIKAFLIGYFQMIQGDIENKTQFCITPEFVECFGEAANLDGVVALMIVNLDCSLDNIILRDGVPNFIDYEWVYDFPFPVDLLIYRVLHNTYYDLKNYIDPLFSKEEFFHLYDFKIENAILHKHIQHFHDYVCFDPELGMEPNQIRERYLKPAFSFATYQDNIKNEILQLGERVMNEHAVKTQLNQTLEQVMADAAQTDEQLAQTTEQLSQTSEQLTQTTGQLTQITEQLSQTTEQLTQTSEQLAQSRLHVQGLENQLTQTTTANQQLQLQLAAVYDSDSWRITKPLRACSAWLQNAMNRWLLTRLMLKFIKRIKRDGFINASLAAMQKIKILLQSINIKRLKKTCGYLCSGNFMAIKNAVRIIINEEQDLQTRLIDTDIVKWHRNNTLENFVPVQKVYQLKIDVVIPVYNGFEFLEPLFNSISRTQMRYNLIIVNDCSPDERVLPFLNNLANCNHKITLINNDQNLGFVRSVNKALQAAKNHVVIVNTDVVLPNLWLERLVTPFVLKSGVASVTPFTNAGTICSFPDFCEDNKLFLSLAPDEIDNCFMKIKPSYVSVPTGVGFCMALHKKALEAVGYLDDQTFSRGYGEENDWCQRAIKLGFSNVIAENLFVYHKHGGSFVSEEKAALIKQNGALLNKKHPNYDKDVSVYCANDVHKTLRIYMAARISVESSAQPSILVFDHNWGGGAGQYCDNYCQAQSQKGHSVFLVKYAGAERDIFLLDVISQGDIFHFAFKDIFNFLEQLQNVSLDSIVINELVSYKDIFKLLESILLLKQQKQVKLVMHLHDYFSVCPSVVLLDPNKIYCNIPSMEFCETCLPNNTYNTNPAYNTITIQNWRSNWGAFLEKCDAIISFSNSSKEIICKAYKGVENVKIIPHKVDYISKLEKQEKKAETEQINIGIIGAVDERKGIIIIKEMLNLIHQHNLKVHITLIGYHNQDIRDANFKVTGPYEKCQINQLTVENEIDIFFISSIVPETFSYTAEEAMQMDMPVACFNIGAPAERIKQYSKGLIISKIDAQTSLHEIISFASFLKQQQN